VCVCVPQRRRFSKGGSRGQFTPGKIFKDEDVAFAQGVAFKAGERGEGGCFILAVVSKVAEGGAVHPNGDGSPPLVQTGTAP